MRKQFLSLVFIAVFTFSCNTPVAVRFIATSTPEATTTPTTPPATPTVTPTPTLPPTPTPPPAVKVENAEKELVVGDFEQARRDFQEAQSAASEPEVKEAATFGMGKALFLSHNYSTAIETLQGVISANPQGPHAANAYYFLARSLEQQKIYDQAAEAYTKFLELRPGVLDAYIQDLRGDDYMAAGNPAAAAAAYDASIKAPQSGSTVWTELKLGKTYTAMGDFTNAIKKYLDIYENNDNDYARAQANFLLGQAYLGIGQTEQAHTRFMDGIASFPKSFDSYSGLVQLVNDGVIVNELSRGLVDYYAGQYGLAIDAFTRYIDTSQPQDATAYHYRALSHLAKGEPGLAIEDWDTVINQFPTDSLWSNAWDEKAYTQWAYLDKYDDAANTLLQFIEKAPDSSRAAEFLFMAARVMERNNKLPEAAAAWEKMIDQYPNAEQSYRGLFLAGITYYRAANYDKALTVFQRALVLATDPNEEAAAYLWVGKTQKIKGDQNAANTAWQQAAQRDPTGYYSVRANELLQNLQPFTVNRPVDLGYDLAQERGQAEQWMRTTFTLPEGTDLNGLGDMGADPRLQRAAAFWELGLYAEARDEIEPLRQSVLNDPVKTYQLMNYMLNLGLYRSAILSSRQILDLANLDDVGTLKAPAYFNHIRFGVYFKDQVVQSSQKEELHPLFLLSVLRQESMFESFAISSAGARGLMQIMPATGQEIVSSLNWPDNYNADDLERPEVSITLGSRYLARQRDYFGSSLFATLAAYNGGPGNTTYWKDLAGDDPDLLLEVIRADETRKYITQIYEFFNIYRLLYDRGL
jgi:soluble lytic murein transglycosylase